MSTGTLTGRPGQAAADLDRFFALSIDMLCIAGFDGYFKYVNPAWEHTLGWTPGELTSKPWSYFVHPEDLARSLAEEAKQRDRGLDAISFEHRFLAKDGSYHWLRWNSRPSPEYGEMHAVARDVTTQKQYELEFTSMNESLERQVGERSRAAEARAVRAERAEQALRDSEARAEAILLTAVEGIISIDEHGIIESLNPAIERLFGYTTSELIGVNVSVLMPSPDAERHSEHVAHYRVTGKPTIIGVDREVVGKRRDGSVFPIDIAVSEVLLGDRRVFTGIIRDISERKAAELALRATADDLRRANGELEAFVHSVSHDLKEPLRTLDAFSKFLMLEYGDKLDDGGKDYLRRLALASSRMKQLIDTVLTISRIGRQEDEPRSLILASVVDDLTVGMRRALSERNATVEVIGDVPTILAGRRRVEQVFGDLIVNGIKFNRSAAPRVEIGASVNDAGEGVFFVRDNGIGIESEYYERIFGIFQRLHRREEFEGTGAGLAIVKRAVESLGGRIWVESDVDGGTTFFFTLPLAPAEAPPELAAS